MKTLSKILTLVLLMISLSATASHRDVVEKIHPRYKNIFFFKTDKKFLGAKVEIVSATGNVIAAQNLEHRKMAIDFGSVKYGTYTIRVSKGAETKEFLFVKK